MKGWGDTGRGWKHRWKNPPHKVGDIFEQLGYDNNRITRCQVTKMIFHHERRFKRERTWEIEYEILWKQKCECIECQVHKKMESEW